MTTLFSLQVYPSTAEKCSRVVYYRASLCCKLAAFLYIILVIILITKNNTKRSWIMRKCFCMLLLIVM